MATGRIVKAPDERKQELLDTAMRLFIERGFSATSMRDIAREANVTPGLAYHYFDNKQQLFSEALEAYAARCTADGIRVLDDPALPLMQKVDMLLASIAHLPYHEFFHKEGNRAFHDELSVRMCDLIVPHLAAAIAAEGRRRGCEIAAPQTLADFIAHGLINLVSDPDSPDPQVLKRVRSYIAALVSAQVDQPAD